MAFTDSTRSLDRLAWLGAAVITAAGLLAYHNSLAGPFVFDDVTSIVTNPSIRQLWPPWAALSPPTGESMTVEGRPLLNLSFAINYALGGTDVFGYHVTNLTIHLLAALALFGVLRRMLSWSGFASQGGMVASFLALVIALLWEVHPVQTESVTYVVQRAESLMGLCYLLTLYCFIRSCAARSGAAWAVASVAVCLCGMATKEVMVSAPLMVFLYDATFIAGGFPQAWRLRTRYYGALAASWLLFGWLVARGGGNRSGIVGFGIGSSAWQYWGIQCEAMVHYLRLTVWPAPLVFEYGVFAIEHPLRLVAGALIVIVLLTATVRGLRRRSAVGFAGFGLFALLAPTSLLPSTTQTIVEHRLYLPLAVGLGLLVTGVYRVLLQRPTPARDSPRTVRWLGAAGMALVVALGLLTVRRNTDYAADLGLWRDTVAKRPANALARHLLAEALEQAGQSELALAEYREAARLRPGFALPQGRLGLRLLRLGRAAEARVHLEQAVEWKPDFVAARVGLGVLLMEGGRAEAAVPHLAAALAIDPAASETHYHLATALRAVGRLPEAIDHYRAAVQLRPGFVAAHYQLGRSLMESGRAAEANESYETVIRLRPDHAEAHNNLGNALARTGRFAEAVSHYEASLRAKPGQLEANFNLANALLELGRRAEAEAHYAAAVKIDPAFAPARAQLERLQRERLR